MKEWIKRQFCRAGLHKYVNGWSIGYDSKKQERWCSWCHYTEIRDKRVYSLSQILYAWATKERNEK